MADVRNPPPGPPARDPTAPARLLDAASEVSQRSDRAQRRLEELDIALERLFAAIRAASG